MEPNFDSEVIRKLFDDAFTQGHKAEVEGYKEAQLRMRLAIDGGELDYERWPPLTPTPN